MKYSSALVVLVVLSGCSALVNPDPGRLDGHDASIDTDATIGRDGGTGVDAPIPDGGGTDAPPICAGGCDDGVSCTDDRCMAGTCAHVPDDEICSDGERCDPTDGCVTRPCDAPEDCQDGDFCNGDERCMPGAKGSTPLGCLPAAAPRDCSDTYSCTVDTCDGASGVCAHTPDHAMCADSIDCTMEQCDPSSADTPTGCVVTPNDALCPYCLDGVTCDPTVGCMGGVPRDCRDGNPCTTERCDEPTRMCETAPRDDDLDGYPADMVSGTDCGGTDCDDSNGAIHPGATEVCSNAADDNCNGMIDEGCPADPPDTCADAQALRVADDGTVTVVTGRFSTFNPDYQSPCGSTGGRDAVYYVDVTGVVDITIDTIGSSSDTVVAVALDCSSSGFRLGCDDDIDTGATTDSRVWVHRVGPAPGTLSRRVYILVDGYNGSATGAFTLNVSMERAAADACAGTPIDITGGGSLVGFLVPPILPTIGPQGSCQSVTEGGETEAIARVTIPSDGNVAFDAYSNGFDPDLYLRASPCATGSELDCNHGDGVGSAGYTYSTRMETSATPGSTTYFFCDGAGATSAYFVSYDP